MKKYALVVGISEYADPEITDLSFAARDAEEVGLCLRETCGFDDVRTLASGGGSEPTHVNVVDALHNLAPLLSPDDLFLFYFAGHGIETKTGAHILTSNSRIRMPELASVSKEVLSSCLSRVECANRVLILDACRNDPHKGMGDEDNLLTSGFSRDIMAVAETPVEGVVPTTCVLFSCRLGERAYEWPDKGHGAFTHYLLEGMRGAAADDRGRITVQALGRYVEAQVPRWAKKFRTPRPQTPWGERKGSWQEVVLASRAGSALRPQLKSTPSPKPVTILPDPALHVETLPPGAALTVDGRAAGIAPQKLTLAAGEHRILAEKDDHKPWERRIRFDATGDAHLKIELEARPRVVEAFFPMTADQAGEVQRTAAEALGTPLAVDLEYGRGVTLPVVLVPAGRFLMGSPETEVDRSDDEGPQYEVTISRPFYIGVHEVTQSQYKAVTGKAPSHFKGSENPVESVSWDDATAFCRRLSAQTGRAVRLPTEAEWEYACRAGTTTPFHTGKTISTDQANYDGNFTYGCGATGEYRATTTAVGSFQPNAFALYDVHGNVGEWCNDWYADSYTNADVRDPKGPATGAARVLRGGSWDDVPAYCRSARRLRGAPDLRSGLVGFRVVVDLE